MAASAPNDTTPHQPDPRPTGDLEYLFQQKFAEAEVTPRASFWDQLDHELVVQQHEQIVQENTAYRRRLVLHRWVAAACLLLALGFGSWAYLGSGSLPASDELAVNTGFGSAAGQQATAGSVGTLDGNETLSAAGAESSSQSSNSQAAAGLLAAINSNADEQAVLGMDRTYASAAGTYHSANTYGLPAGQEAGVEYGLAGAHYASERYAPGAAGILQTNASTSATGTDTYSFAGSGLLTPRAAYLRNLLGLGRPDTLKPALLAVPQPAITEGVAATTPEEEQKETPKLWKRLRLGGGYAVGTFNPNINFSRTDGRVKADPVSNALRSYYQEEAEDEYRRNLRSGLSQRVALTASFALNKHWTLTAAAEAAELRATSATTYGFIDGKQVGPQAADIFSRPAAYNSALPQPRTTSYRYRTATVPVGVRYGSSKAGLSLYTKVGAAVSVLLSSRSELEGSPAATRSYTYKSTDSPYRQVLVSGRGGAGVRYQPASASWNLNVGPTAETYFTTLNANPSQRAINQSRPYSLGLEASVEFGAPKPMPGVQ
ncbi:hypothetical protein [Hymenobacter pini]|uniref:hypothetical protein n=1 Tax=Hymenobacter pini TaxID=2880879 RepID=UPI001CF4B56E|nr:hypothetical protein [Hymenobacter pini]MCA8831788.1 hypothetical protein [Hymenobacter pini]